MTTYATVLSYALGEGKRARVCDGGRIIEFSPAGKGRRNEMNRRDIPACDVRVIDIDHDEERTVHALKTEISGYPLDIRLTCADRTVFLLAHVEELTILEPEGTA